MISAVIAYFGVHFLLTFLTTSPLVTDVLSFVFIIGIIVFSVSLFEENDDVKIIGLGLIALGFISPFLLAILKPFIGFISFLAAVAVLFAVIVNVLSRANFKGIEKFAFIVL